MNQTPEQLAVSVRKGARRAVYNAAIKLAKAMFVQRGEAEAHLQFIMMPDAYDQLTNLAEKHRIQSPTGFWFHWGRKHSTREMNWSCLSYEEQLIGILFYAEMILTGDLDNIDGKLDFN